MSDWKVGDRVQVSLGTDVLPGIIDRINDVGPSDAHPERTHRVRFDDPLVFGGLGTAWFDPTILEAAS